MGSRHQRVTNGERAAVCALVIAGMPFVETCQMLGVPYRNVQAVLPRDWWHPRRRRPSRWSGDVLLALEDAYRQRALKLDTIAAMFNTSRRQIECLAQRHGWPKRTRGKGPPLPIPLAKLSPEDRNRFVKLRRIIGRSAAEKAVFG